MALPAARKGCVAGSNVPGRTDRKGVPKTPGAALVWARWAPSSPSNSWLPGSHMTALNRQARGANMRLKSWTIALIIVGGATLVSLPARAQAASPNIYRDTGNGSFVDYATC